jgi:hypothetical protein
MVVRIGSTGFGGSLDAPFARCALRALEPEFEHPSDSSLIDRYQTASEDGALGAADVPGAIDPWMRAAMFDLAMWAEAIAEGLGLGPGVSGGSPRSLGDLSNLGWSSGARTAWDRRPGFSAFPSTSNAAPNGAITFTSGMTIDSDGARSSYGDRTHQSQTALQWHVPGTGTVNAAADKIPYISLSMSWRGRVQPGDLAKVSYQGRSVYAIVGDFGPTRGEASMATAAALGIDPNPRNGGTRSGVTYSVLPKSGAEIRARPTSFAEIQAIGARLFVPAA